tara:strand:+ start:1491 stop:1991 length:501 start_codon:yes stop_codon:yes gene_type:complete
MMGCLMEFWHFGVPSVSGVERMAQTCEELNFDGLTSTDSQNLSNEIYIALTLAAKATNVLKLGPTVTNPITRQAAVTASAAATLQEASYGRMVISIGRGDSSVFNIGVKPAKPDLFRKYVEDIQSYLSRDVLNKNGCDSQLRWLVGSKLPKVLLDVVATGPKIIAM